MQFPFTYSRDKEFDVVGFGTNAVDFLIQVPQYPAFNSKIELTDYVRAAGGEIATTTAALRRLGLKTAYVGRFGDDDAGNLGIESLKKEGVDLRFAEQIQDSGTQIAFIIIDKRNGERTIIWHRDPKLAYDDKDAPIEAATLGSVFHFTPHDTAACLEMAKAAKASGAITSIDIDKIFDDIDTSLQHVDIIIASAEFPEKLLGIKDHKIALKEIGTRFGCGIVGITLGDAGSLILCGDTFIETRGFDVPGGCKDTTGAGDSFRAGFLYGLLKGESVEESARMANAVAALKCRAVGARTSLPANDELNDFLSGKSA